LNKCRKVSLLCIGAALAVLAEVVAEEAVEHGGVDYGEVTIDSRGAHP
jgi:hypothetical protein